MNKNLSLSNTLVILSIVFTALSYIIPNFYQFGMNNYFLSQGIYHIYFIQFFTSNFIHGGVLHLLFNSAFVYYFWNQVEQILWYKRYLLFFVWNIFFIGIGLTLLSSGNTIGISGFALAILTYYTLHLRSIGNPEYTGGITAIVINIAIGLSPGISFLGHFLGMIFGGIYFYVIKVIKKRS